MDFSSRCICCCGNAIVKFKQASATPRPLRHPEGGVRISHPRFLFKLLFELAKYEVCHPGIAHQLTSRADARSEVLRGPTELGRPVVMDQLAVSIAGEGMLRRDVAGLEVDHFGIAGD